MKVLFLGNSLTYFNGGVDYHFKLLCPGHLQPHVEALTAGGASLRRLWRKTRAKKIIRETAWDVIVLQEDLPETTVDYFLEYGSRFVQLIETVHPDCRPLFFEAWAYARIPTVSNRDIRTAHLQLCSQLDVECAPVQQARLEAARRGIHVWAPDMEHPNVAGTFLAALVIFYSIFPDSIPSKYIAQGIKEAEARVLGEIAASTCHVHASIKCACENEEKKNHLVEEAEAHSSPEAAIFSEKWSIIEISKFLDAEALTNFLCASSSTTVLCAAEIDESIWKPRFYADFGEFAAKHVAFKKRPCKWRLAYLSEVEYAAEIRATTLQGMC